ncbi:BBE domain-containing protein [Fictibacillus halophilus]
MKDWLEQCYFENLPRLIKVKTKYDPENLFNFPLGIPTKREL